MRTNTQTAQPRAIHLTHIFIGGARFPFFMEPLPNNIVKVSFFQSELVFVYIKYNSADDLEKYLIKGIKYFMRDKERNPFRTSKHSIIFNA